MRQFERKGTIVRRKFYKFLLPTLLSNLAVSLNEFVDSMIVAQLLGSEAMSLVNMGFPVMLVFSTVYTMLGVGGSIVYVEHAGNQEEEDAKRAFSLTLLVAAVLAVIILVLGLLFIDPLSRSMCSDDGLRQTFLPYLRLLFVSGVLIVPLQVVIIFMPSLGRPGTGTMLNIVTNAVNLAFDYIYIRFFGTGFTGVGMATFTGYAAAVLILGVLIISRRIVLPFTFDVLKYLRRLPSLALRGLSPAVNQFGYCIKLLFCNYYAMFLGGISGVEVFSLCMQCVSIISVFLGGVIEAMIPIVSSLRGQRDFNGVSLLVKTVMKVQFAANLAFTVILEVFPQIVLFLYGVEGDLVKPAVTGIRIFAIMFVFRGFVILFMYYFQIIDRNAYAIMISIIDGFAGVIPLVLVLSKLFGINGMWAAFPVLSVLMLVTIVIVNSVIVYRSAGKYRGLLLIENEDSSVSVYDSTIKMDEKDASENAQRIQEFCAGHGLNKQISAIAAVASEEMAVYAMKESTGSDVDQIDVLVKIYPDYVLMDYRSIGQPFNLLNAPAEEYSGVDVLKKLATSIEYGYVVGINQTRIKINTEARPESGTSWN